ncbi:pyridoxal phosphate-dependent aminotransferase [Leucothrix mucor]|uniref:pyridoxal phosphate-dependent aminotransferase n=1 Tax=Leucothrix mucor TaxID=45248 RepID=UPI0003B3886C|nr:pyridoxal phosphate-dependent aminotransferase [Leucothrix mucor]
MLFHSKLPNVKTTIFTVMSQLASEYQALNLSQGFPDFNGPDELLGRVTEHMRLGHNQYAPMTGVQPLREAITAKALSLYQASVDTDQEITVTSGATDALFTAITTIVSTGDEVIVFDPAYDSYEPAIELAGGKAVHIPLLAPDFKIDWQQVEDSITSKTRAIIMNSPHNPTGTTLSEADIQALQAIVAKHDILLISDEVYEHIVFDGEPHLSLLRYPDLRERAFVNSSFGKTYHVTGWKIAYCIAPAELTAEFRKVHQYVSFCTVSPMQFALADFMQSSPHHLELADFYQAKRDRFVAGIQDSRFKLLPCAGTYFQLLDHSEISELDDVALARQLTIEKGIASIPISVFYQTPPAQKILRFCFAKNDETLDRATELLCTI